jgi:hypothetical protein
MSAAKKLGRYMTAEPVGVEPEAYIISSSRTDDKIGLVEWYTPWGEHIFDAESGAVLSRGCLLDLADFLADLNREAHGHSPGEQHWSET